MSSLTSLPLPQVTAESDGNTSIVGGWDETFGDAEWRHSTSARPSISSHAIAHGCHVFGTCNDTKDWITWNKSFAPHRVCRVASNHDGSIVVASTDGGTVSLLRGSDGKALATRKVTTSEGLQPPAEITFVSGADRHRTKDVLIIQVPPIHDDGEGNSEEQLATNVILVSCIDGARLNNENPATVAEAAREMSINGLSLDLSSSSQVISLNGCFTNSNAIRFMACDSNGNLSIHDYNIEEKRSVVIKADFVTEQMGDSWTFDSQVGFKHQPFGHDNSFFILSLLSESTAKICWYDMIHLTFSCEYELSIKQEDSSSTRKSRPKLFAVEPVRSCSDESSLAIAVALKSPDSTEGTVHVIQAVADATLGLVVLSQPHLVYEIPQTGADGKPTAVQAIDLASVTRSSTGPYSFRSNLLYGAEEDECKEFVTSSPNNDGSTVGTFRLLIAKDMYDAADELLASDEAQNLLSTDRYALVHSSEVALRRMQMLLSSGSVSSAENMIIARECLRRLAAGAVSGNEIGLRCLTNAADTVISWPSQEQSPSVGEYCTTLATLSSTIDNAMQAAPPSHFLLLEGRKKKLDESLSAMKCMREILAAGPEAVVSSPFASVHSVGDLFCTLVTEGFFPVAERLTRSEWGRDISPELMASSVLGISPTVDPRGYATLLQDIVIPGLSVSHEVLPLIRRWTCRTAEAFDVEESDKLGLDSSIFLLQAVANATNKLNLRIHSSYSSYTPFVDRRVRTRLSPSNAAGDSSLSRDTSFSSINSSQSVPARPSRSISSRASCDEPPNPTLLELGRMRGGAMKNRLTALSSNRTKASLVDEDDDSDDCVEVRLRQAILLKEARSLGLTKPELNLRTYSGLGGAHYVAKNLVREFSCNATDHDGRFVVLTSLLQPLCEKAGVSYDNVLVEHVKHLCGGKTINEKALLESASVSRCCSTSVAKCQASLVVLRAAHLWGKSSSCLKQLSQDALVWASGESSIRSELEEANRLLVIDGIILRYCGTGAMEIFHVDEPRHSVQLLDFVCRHIAYTKVLSDALDLCDAFKNLSRADACVLLLQRAVIAGNVGRCLELFEDVYGEDEKLAREACEKTVAFCAETVRECSEEIMQVGSQLVSHTKKRQSETASEAAVSMLALFQAHCRDFFAERIRSHHEELQSSSWGSLHHEFKRISELQKNHGVFLALTDLRSATQSFEAAKTILHPVAEFCKDGSDDKLLMSFGKARRGCSLLLGSDQLETSRLWCGVVKEVACHLSWASDDGRCIDFLAASGILNEIGTRAACQTVVSVALSLCFKASQETPANIVGDETVISRMKYVIRASSLLQDCALIRCPPSMLPVVVSISTLTDIVSQILTRADEGVGEALDCFRIKLNKQARLRREPIGALGPGITRHTGDVQLYGQPALHPTWYVGDGLLLPPLEALAQCILYCKELMAFIKVDSKRANRVPMPIGGTEALHGFLATRGAHAIGLRMLCNSLALRLSSAPSSSLDNEGMVVQSDAVHIETARCLAERSLGGSGNGITSGTIDSQLAVSFLLWLPIKLAFKVYKASLPTAMARRNFPRVITLSNIGIHAGKGGSIGGDVATGWKKQAAFVTQCQGLSAKARWWKILQQYKVEFDPRRFDDNTSVGTNDAGVAKPGSVAFDSRYIASLVPFLIRNASKSLTCDETLQLVTKFVIAFGLDPNIAAQKHVQYLLSAPSENETSTETEVTAVSGIRYHADIRHTLILCERAAKHSLRLLPSVARSAVLRRCVCDLESTEGQGTDYDRHFMVLALYNSELSLVVAQGLTRKVAHLKAFKEELELIERRQDALEILSSFFQGRRKAERPIFPKFFTPLPVPFNPEKTVSENQKICGVLGSSFEEARDAFDPLNPLMEYLSQHPDTNTAKALAPLCLSLGIPKGYIHARALVERFNLASSKGVSLPSYDGDVLPVVNRLQSSSDKTKLLEWCVSQYPDGDDKFKCLDHALEWAMKASSEAEQRRCSGIRGDDTRLAKEEILALDAVKRISEAKSVLSDKLLVRRIFLPNSSIKLQQVPHRTPIVDDLVKRLEDKYNEGPSPESVVEFILSESSLLVANASLEEDVALSVSNVRSVASLTHQGCRALAEQNSHVHAGQIARRLARRWLVHGDQAVSEATAIQPTSVSSKDVAVKMNSSSLSVVEEEEDTVDFVMDLSSLGGDEQVWSDDVGSGVSFSSTQQKKVTTEEEPSGLRLDGSWREASEGACSRVALRIAFALSFAEGLFPSSKGESLENVRASSSNQGPSRNNTKKGRTALLARITTTSQQSITVVEHTKELLRIIFAKSGGSHQVSNLVSQSLFTAAEDAAESRRPITFAMRHRALRTAALLCPQEALDQVIKEEGYLITSNSEMECTLKNCTFGCFVAKEIEEMGLPLPHSDLVALSTMHFPSYARALWRHHRSAECNGYKGRLLLLLLEMSLKEDTITDRGLVVSIVGEMSEMQLPRSLLIGCEKIASFKKRASENEFSSLREQCDEVLSAALTKVAKTILGELHKSVRGEKNSLEWNAMPTLCRLGQVVEQIGTVKDHLLPFINVMLGIVVSCSDKVLSEGIASISLCAIYRLEDGECKRNLLLKLAGSESGKVAIGKRISPIPQSGNNDQKEKDAQTLFGMASRLASSTEFAVAQVLHSSSNEGGDCSGDEE